MFILRGDAEETCLIATPASASSVDTSDIFSTTKSQTKISINQAQKKVVYATVILNNRDIM